MKGWVERLKRLIDTRREPRLASAQNARLTVAGKEHQVRLLDISPSGAMIGFGDPLDAGENVIIHVLDREPLRGQVRWSREGRVGIGFETAMKQVKENGQR